MNTSIAFCAHIISNQTPQGPIWQVSFDPRVAVIIKAYRIKENDLPVKIPR